MMAAKMQQGTLPPGRRTVLVVLVLISVLAGVGSVFDLRPGSADSAGHLGRLWDHVHRIASAPHSLGTLEHDEVRDYILGTLREYGLEPQVQQATSVLDARDLVRVAEVQNILARVPGRSPGHALLVVAHYDSAPVSLGAGDDGAAVACLLELAYALKRGPTPTNDVIFLFSDGEEWGLLGARSFLTHPWAKEIQTVVNLDARGSAGRPVLLQTAGATLRLLALLKQSRAPLWAASYVGAGFKASGNDTDFSVFERRGWSGYNIAFFEQPQNYHTSLDTPANLDARTLGQMDEVIQRLVRTLADSDLTQLRAGGEATYMSLPGGFVVSMSQQWVQPLALALVACALLLTAFRLRPAWKSVAEILVWAICGTAAAVTVVGLIDESLASRFDALVRWPEHDGFFAAAMLAVAGLAALLCGWSSRLPAEAQQVASVAALVVLLAVGGCTIAFFLPSAAFLLLVPAVLGCLMILFSGGYRFSALLLPPLIFLWVQTIWQLATGLGMRAQWFILPLAALMALIALLVTGARLSTRRLWGGGLLLLAAISAGTAGATAYFDSAHPRMDHLLNVVDLESRRACWFSFDKQLDTWNSRYLENARQDDLRSLFGGHEFRGFSAPRAYPPQLTGGQISLSTLDGNEADLRLRASPAAAVIRIDLYSESTIVSARLNGIALPIPSRQDSGPGRARLTLVYFNPPKAAVPLHLKLADPRSLSATLLDVTLGAGVPDRPAGFAASPESPTDGLYVRENFQLIQEN